MSPLPITLFSFALFLFISACQGPLGQARSAFDEARYADAVGQLQTLDRSKLDHEERYQHALYAGLTHLSLGDLRRALPYLTTARRGLDRNPRYFSLAQRGQLMSAWHSLGLMPGQPLRLPSTLNR